MYSPERINPGETKYKLINIKVVGADSKKTLEKTSKLYQSIIKQVSKVSSKKLRHQKQ